MPSSHMPSSPTLTRGPRCSLLVSLAALALAACGGDGEGDAPPPARGPQQVEAVEARLEPLAVTTAAVGSLMAEATAELRTEAAGVVARIPVDEGATVARGQTLVLLDDSERAAEVAAAEAALERARTEAANLEARRGRNRDLLAAGAISPQAFDDIDSAADAARARVAEAEAALRLARRRLDKSVIKAPFAGRVGARDFHVGDYLDEGARVMNLVDDDPLEVEFSLPERFVDRVEPGAAVTVSLRDGGRGGDGHGGGAESVSGGVTFVAPEIDRASRTFLLKAQVPNPEGALRPGQFVGVEVVLERRAGAVMVPEEAIVPRGGKNFVFVVDGGTAHRVEVAIGARQRGRVEIASGVEAGSQVVVAGQQKIDDGAAVEIRLPDATETGAP